MSTGEPTLITGTIDAIYELDDYYLESIAVEPVSSVHQQVPFDSIVIYRVYFDQFDNRYKAEDDDCPHADIFMQSDKQRSIEYNFIPTATPAQVKSLWFVVRAREFQRMALRRWGGFKLIWGGPENTEAYDVGANMVLYFDDQLAFVTLRRVGVPAEVTFVELSADFLFLREAVSKSPQSNVFRTLPTGETKKISNLSDTPDQEEDINPQGSEIDTEDDDPASLYQWIMPT